MVTFTPISTGTENNSVSIITNFFVDIFSDITPPSAIPGQYNFVFYLENTSSAPVEYNFSQILNSTSTAPIGIGTIPANSTAQVAFTSSTGTLQFGNVSLVSPGGQPLNMRFWSGYSGLAEMQYINIIAENGFSITEDTSIQNNASGNGYSIGVGGHGGALRTDNIWIMMS